MIEGLGAIKNLSKGINSKEKVSSSHWDFYHKDFKYDKGILSGLIGFGNLNKPYKGFHKKVHQCFAQSAAVRGPNPLRLEPPKHRFDLDGIGCTRSVNQGLH